MGYRRVALVTGSTSGIGLATAKKLIDDGFAIAFHSRSSEKTGKSLAQSYPNTSYTQADLADEDRVRQLISEVLYYMARKISNGKRRATRRNCLLGF